MSAGIAPTCVMVVDDEPMIRQLVSAVLTTSGYHVVDAGSPEQALRILARHPGVDLLVTDIVMPNITGRELASRMLQVLPRLRVLFMSGFQGHPGHEIPTASFLQKPFRIPELLDRVRHILA